MMVSVVWEGVKTVRSSDVSIEKPGPFAEGRSPGRSA